MKTYKPAAMAALLDVSVKTLQRWDKSGKLVARRNEAGRRFYTLDDLIKFKFRRYKMVESMDEFDKAIALINEIKNKTKDEKQKLAMQAEKYQELKRKIKPRMLIVTKELAQMEKTFRDFQKENEADGRPVF